MANINEQVDPTQYAQATGQESVPAEKRWSHHLANNPYGEAGDWALQFYNNPNIDPNAAIQGQISQFRNQYGSAAPEDDMGVLKMLASGGTPQPKTPAQSWNTGGGGAQSPFGGSGQALLDQLMGRAKQGLAVDLNDPTVRSQVDPFTAQMERASRNYLDTVSEGTHGVPFNMQGERRMAAERLGQQAGQMESQVIGREIGARRDEIAQALQMWGGLFSDDQRNQLQRELGYLNASTQRYGIDTGRDTDMRRLALDEWRAYDDSDYRWLFG